MSEMVLWVLGILGAEFILVMVMLGTWIEDGRRRARDIERLEALARDLQAPGRSSGDVA
jgi:hypothetical protein